MAEPTTSVGQSLQLFTTPSPIAPCDVGSMVAQVWEHYQQWHPHARLDQKRSRVIRDRLADGYTPTQLCEAISGCHGDAWYRGDNDRGKAYCDLSLILRDADHVDRFMDLHWRPRTPTNESGTSAMRRLGLSDDQRKMVTRMVATGRIPSEMGGAA